MEDAAEQLPDDPDALREFLEGAINDLESAAQREREKRRRKLDTLREYSARLSETADKLKGLPEAEKSARLKAAVDSEISALQAELEPQPAAQPASEPEPEVKRRPLPADAFDRARQMFEDAQKLKLAAPRLDLRELECLVNAQAGRARELQASHPQFRNHDVDPGRALHRTFGTFSSLAREFFKDRNIWVDALNVDHETNWTMYSDHWEEELWHVREELTEEEKRRTVEQEEARRKRQIDEANQRVFAQLLDEIAEHVRFAPTDEDSLWAVDLRELVAEALDYGDPGDDRLLNLVAPFAALFGEGHAFRGLRRKLRKEGDLPGPGISTRLEAVTTTVSRGAEDPLRAWLRSKLAGLKAAVVGGSKREHRRETIQKFFGLAEVEWIENEREQAANSKALGARIVNGQYDIIFMLSRFTSHALHDRVKEACKESGVPFALVEGGYGISALCRAMAALGDRATALAGSPPPG